MDEVLIEIRAKRRDDSFTVRTQSKRYFDDSLLLCKETKCPKQF